MTRESKRVALGVGCLACLVLAAGSALAGGEFDKAARLGMLGDHEGALREYESFIYDHPAHELAPLAALAAGNLYLEVHENYDTAVLRFDQVVSDYPTSAWAPEAARRKGDEAYERALDLAAERSEPQQAEWINEVTASAGDCFYRAGDSERVLQIYGKALEGNPPTQVAATALYRMGETYEAMEEPEKAAESYARMLEEYPGAGVESVRQGMGKRELIDQHTTIDWKPYEIGLETNGLIQQRNYAAALEKCNEAEACCKNPRLLECVEYQKIALEATISGNYGIAYRRMEQYLQAYPNPQLGPQIDRNLDQWSQIIEMESEVDRSPEDVELAAALGTQYLRAGSFAKSIDILENTRGLDPDRAATYQLLGYAYNAAGRADDSARAFEKYLESNPDDTNALNVVGYSFLGQEQYDKAIQYFERYVELSPDEANPRDSLGEGYFRAGRLEEALREYSKAVEIDPSFFNSYFFLGRIYQQMEKKDQAIEAYERLIELNPNGAQADQARSALEELRQ